MGSEEFGEGHERSRERSFSGRHRGPHGACRTGVDAQGCAGSLSPGVGEDVAEQPGGEGGPAVVAARGGAPRGAAQPSLRGGEGGAGGVARLDGGHDRVPQDPVLDRREEVWRCFGQLGQSAVAYLVPVVPGAFAGRRDPGVLLRVAVEFGAGEQSGPGEQPQVQPMVCCLLAQDGFGDRERQTGGGPPDGPAAAPRLIGPGRQEGGPVVGPQRGDGGEVGQERAACARARRAFLDGPAARVGWQQLEQRVGGHLARSPVAPERCGGVAVAHEFRSVAERQRQNGAFDRGREPARREPQCARRAVGFGWGGPEDAEHPGGVAQQGHRRPCADQTGGFAEQRQPGVCVAIGDRGGDRQVDAYVALALGAGVGRVPVGEAGGDGGGGGACQGGEDAGQGFQAREPGRGCPGRTGGEQPRRLPGGRAVRGRAAAGRRRVRCGAPLSVPGTSRGARHRCRAARAP
ncbi:hypothetical protein GCM10010346_20450 [Streptomyces chryseus]|uniref:Uncharacterized protein n=1 Tax=Streptomyces chryseus TaxID=68186 RepID=A0ABQ3DIC4_9ACTN|nr:hypothetical protein GCM10010346_20450 [Streptomyces chryseus]